MFSSILKHVPFWYSADPFAPDGRNVTSGQEVRFRRFKNGALDQLQTFFPDTLEKWDALFDEPLSALEDVMESHTFELINVALELHINRVLPVAFLTCVRDFQMVCPHNIMPPIIIWN